MHASRRAPPGPREAKWISGYLRRHRRTEWACVSSPCDTGHSHTCQGRLQPYV